MSSSSRLVVWGLSLSPLVTSFNPHQCTPTSLSSRTRSSPPSPTSTRVPHRCPALHLAKNEAQRDKGGTAERSSKVSEFEQTSGPVKAFVGGLTDLFVSFSGGGKMDPPAVLDESPKVCVVGIFERTAATAAPEGP